MNNVIHRIRFTPTRYGPREQPPPPDEFFILAEDGQQLITENNQEITLENE